METKIRKNGEEYEAYIDREWRRTGFYKAVLHCDDCGCNFEGSVYIDASIGQIELDECPGHEGHDVSLMLVEEKIE